MKLTTIIFAALMVVVVCGSAEAQAIGQIIAQSGFNDQSGINSNPTPNSPYTIDATADGRGGSEPGWGGGAWSNYPGIYRAWIVDANTSPVAPFEGDGLLHMQGFVNDQTSVTQRLFPDQFGSFVIQQYLQIPNNGHFESDFMGGPNGTGGHGPKWEAVNNTFWVRDGNGTGVGGNVMIDTGIAVTPMQWQKVGLVIDLLSQTYQFYVNDVKFNATNPLGFEDTPYSIDDVRYWSSSDNWIDAVTIAEVPEPCTLILLLAGTLSFLTYAWRRGRR